MNKTVQLEMINAIIKERIEFEIGDIALVELKNKYLIVENLGEKVEFAAIDKPILTIGNKNSDEQILMKVFEISFETNDELRMDCVELEDSYLLLKILGNEIYDHMYPKSKLIQLPNISI